MIDGQPLVPKSFCESLAIVITATCCADNNSMSTTYIEDAPAVPEEHVFRFAEFKPVRTVVRMQIIRALFLSAIVIGALWAVGFVPTKCIAMAVPGIMLAGGLLFFTWATKENSRAVITPTELRIHLTSLACEKYPWSAVESIEVNRDEERTTSERFWAWMTYGGNGCRPYVRMPLRRVTWDSVPSDDTIRGKRLGRATPKVLGMYLEDPDGFVTLARRMWEEANGEQTLAAPVREVTNLLRGETAVKWAGVVGIFMAMSSLVATTFYHLPGLVPLPLIGLILLYVCIIICAEELARAKILVVLCMAVVAGMGVWAGGLLNGPLMTGMPLLLLGILVTLGTRR